MALIFADGFERYTNSTEFIKVWTSDYSAFETGRIQGKCLRIQGNSNDYNDYVQYAYISPPGLGNATTGYLGIGVKFGFQSIHETSWLFLYQRFLILRLRDGMTPNGIHLDLCTRNGNLALYRGSTLIATGSPVVIGTWYYFEIYWNIHASTGRCIVKRNGTTEIDFTGNTYAGTGNAYVNHVLLTSGETGNSSQSFDDMYISDSEFLGDFRAVRLTPESAGDSTAWTPNTGANYAAVDELTTDGDTTYVSTSTNNAVDLYNLNSPTHGGTSILGVHTRYTVRHQGTNTNFAPVHKTSGGTEQVGTTIPVTSGSYAIKNVLQTTNPQTAVAWTQGDIDGLQIGMKKLT